MTMTDNNGAETAREAAHDARDVAGQTATQASELARDAWGEARQLADHTRAQVRTQADEQTQRAAQGVRSMSAKLRALSEGRTDEAGRAGDLARELSQRVEGWAGRLETGGLDAVLADLSRYARRKPGQFLVACAAAGFAAGRVAKAHRSNSQDSGALRNGNGSYGSLTDPYDRYGTASSYSPLTNVGMGTTPMDPTELPRPAAGTALAVDTPATASTFPAGPGSLGRPN